MTDIKKFLRTEIISNSFIHLDLWSIVHLFTGFALKRFFNLSFTTILVLFIVYEVIEPHLKIFKFHDETLVNQTWDVIIGMIGWYLGGL